MLQDEEHHHKNPAHLLFSRAARWLGCRSYDMYYVERNLHRPIPEFETTIPLEFAQATNDDKCRILAGREPKQHRRLEHHFQSGRTLCYVARTGNGLAGYSFLKTGLMDITGLDAIEVPIREMSRDTGLTHDSYVWPKFRRNRIFHALLQHIYDNRKAAGLNRVCNLIDPANVPSLKVHLDMGARIQRVRFVKFPGTGGIVAGRNFVIGQLDVGAGTAFRLKNRTDPTGASAGFAG